MEEHLNKYSQVLAKAQSALAELEASQKSGDPGPRLLHQPVGRFGIFHRPDFPEDVARGFLGEDAVMTLMEHF